MDEPAFETTGAEHSRRLSLLLSDGMNSPRHPMIAHAASHPVIGHLVEWVPATWLLRLSNPSPSATTDLGSWSPDDTQVDLAELYQDIMTRGMRDPFLVGVGRIDRRVRLEAGNHRVRALLARGHGYLPAVAYVGDSAITHLGNGAHEGELLPLRLLVPTTSMGPYPIKEYARLSSVLSEMPV